MGPKFGTSGLRGLVSELTPDLVSDHVRAFINACPASGTLWVGRDLRPSSPALAAVVLAAAREMGLATVDCGALPTPALALAAMRDGAGAVMVTGSHIPADRNGLKFYTVAGEITKAEEAAIIAARGASVMVGPGPSPRSYDTAGADWVARYVTGFGAGVLAGLRIGVWAHSAVSSEFLVQALTLLGADCTLIGRSDTFVPVDTEAVSGQAQADLAAWAPGFDAIVSTDGDGDRPLLTDGRGQVVPGDILGQITAAALGAKTVVTPVNSNTGAEASHRFARVIRTRIGSPFVIAAMEAIGGRVAGYEANGGFLLGFTAEGPGGPLPPLMTRDSLLPLVAVLAEARRAGGLPALLARQPARFTATDRLEDIPTDTSGSFLSELESDRWERSSLLSALDEAEIGRDMIDGLRLKLASGRILHLRPSGNAPEFRVYVEAESLQTAQGLLARGLGLLRRRLLVE